MGRPTRLVKTDGVAEVAVIAGAGFVRMGGRVAKAGEGGARFGAVSVRGVLAGLGAGAFVVGDAALGTGRPGDGGTSWARRPNGPEDTAAANRMATEIGFTTSSGWRVGR